MPELLHPSRLSLPFLSNPRISSTCLDPQAWATAIQATIPVRICEPLRSRGGFSNQTAIATVGSLAIVATHGSPITVCTDHTATAQLMIPYRGDGTWTIDTQRFSNPAGESLLFTPPAPLALENTVTAGVAINLPPHRLAETAITMAGPEAMPGNLQQLLTQPQRLLLSEPALQPLIAYLYQTLALADQALLAAGQAIEMLRLDDLLIRLIVLLLIPELRCDPSPGLAAFPELSSHQIRNRLSHLTDWIEAHLDQPIGLSDLERQSNFSRRTLQYQFRRFLGCTPMQWVRARRLDQAKARLLQPLPGDTVASIARSVGYSNASSFSRDFHRHHGTTAVEIFRLSATRNP